MRPQTSGPGLAKTVRRGGQFIRLRGPGRLIAARLRSSSDFKTRWISYRDLAVCPLIINALGLACCGNTTGHQPARGEIMAKRKKQSKAQKRGKLPKRNSAKRAKARRVSKAAKAMKRTVARAKPKSRPVKKTARKERMKQPIAPVVEMVAVEVIEQPAPGVITVTEVEETRQVS